MPKLPEKIVINVKKTLSEDEIPKTHPLFDKSTGKTFSYRRSEISQNSSYNDSVAVTYIKGEEIETVEEEPITKRTYKPLGVRFLSEVEVDKEIKSNLTLTHMNLENLVNEANTLIPLEKTDIIQSYSYGYFIREFINQETVISRAIKETSPIIFALAPTISVRLLGRIVTTSKSSRTLKYLSGMKVVEIGSFKSKKKESKQRNKITFRTNDFDTIGNGIADFISKQEDIESEPIVQRFNDELEIFRDGIDEISKKSTSNYNKFKKWHEKKERKDAFYQLVERFFRESRK